MKVALVTLSFPPETAGGTERVADALARALQAGGDEVLVVTTGVHAWPGRDHDVQDRDGIRVHRFFRRDDEWDASGLLRERLQSLVRATLEREDVDLIHAHHLAGLGAGLLPWARESGLGAVLTCHDLWLTCPRYFRAPPEGITCPEGAGRGPCVPCINLDLRRPEVDVRAALAERDRLLRREVQAAHRVTAPSRSAAAAIAEHLPWDGAIEVVPHGLLRAPAGRAAPPAPGEPLRVGTFGNLVPEKGVEDLVRAAGGLGVEVHVYGAFLDEAFAREVAELARRLGVALTCHGSYRQEEHHPALDLHLAVFPSRCRETYGLVVDEALAHGVPALVSDVGAFAERRGQGGVQVAGLDELGGSLASLVRDRAAYDELRASVPDRLPDARAMARRYRALYEEVLRETS